MARLNDRIIGRCSNCGGNVCMPSVWMGVQKPTPTCDSCGARALPSGPVIPMGPPLFQNSQEDGDYPICKRRSNQPKRFKNLVQSTNELWF